MHPPKSTSPEAGNLWEPIAWAELEAGLVPARLSPYLEHASGDRDFAISLYLWNILLCESLYPLLNLGEITLRNRFHQILSQHFQREDWFDDVWLDPRDASKIKDAKKKVADRRLEVTPVRVVSGLTFGFWTSLLDVRYERSHILWPVLAPKIFADAPSRLRTRKEQSRHAAQLRRLRNRVFHHEPIWKLDDLPDVVNQSEIWLSWLNPEIAKLHNLIGRFGSVYSEGPSVVPAIKLI